MKRFVSINLIALTAMIVSVGIAAAPTSATGTVRRTAYAVDRGDTFATPVRPTTVYGASDAALIAPYASTYLTFGFNKTNIPSGSPYVAGSLRVYALSKGTICVARTTTSFDENTMVWYDRPITSNPVPFVCIQAHVGFNRIDVGTHDLVGPYQHDDVNMVSYVLTAGGNSQLYIRTKEADSGFYAPELRVTAAATL